MSDMKLSLVIPCFNEAKNIPTLIKGCAVLLSNPNVELILVNNGSLDETEKEIRIAAKRHKNCRLINIKQNIGYGNGILTGLRSAKGHVLAWTHADLQTDPNDALRGFELFASYGNEIFVKGLREKRPILDNIFTVGMSIFESLLLRKPFWDINAQPTMFSRNFFETWESPPDDFSLDLYAYSEAVKQNKKIKRIAVHFDRRLYGQSSWNISARSKLQFIKRTISFSLKLKKSVEK